MSTQYTMKEPKDFLITAERIAIHTTTYPEDFNRDKIIKTIAFDLYHQYNMGFCDGRLFQTDKFDEMRKKDKI